MNISQDEYLPPSALQFLREAYRFVDREWQHLEREPDGDQGFERCFRESCVAKFPDWTISQEREMRLGEGLETASGVLHEVDIVAQTSDLVAVAEIKNRPSNPPEKNDAIIFFAKLLDYLAFNPSLLMGKVLPVFISSGTFDEHGLAACLGLGIHPIAPGLRPLPVLQDSALRMNAEIQQGIALARDTQDAFEEFCGFCCILLGGTTSPVPPCPPPVCSVPQVAAQHQRPPGCHQRIFWPACHQSPVEPLSAAAWIFDNRCACSPTSSLTGGGGHIRQTGDAEPGKPRRPGGHHPALRLDTGNSQFVVVAAKVFPPVNNHRYLLIPPQQNATEPFCVELNRLSSDLEETWLTSRCGYSSENTIVLKAVGGLPTLALSRELRRLNGDCTELLTEFGNAKARGRI